MKIKKLEKKGEPIITPIKSLDAFFRGRIVLIEDAEKLRGDDYLVDPMNEGIVETTIGAYMSKVRRFAEEFSDENPQRILAYKRPIKDLPSNQRVSIQMRSYARPPQGRI